MLTKNTQNLVSPFRNSVLKKLAKLLQAEQKKINQNFKFNQEIFSFFREKSTRIKEAPMNTRVRLEPEINRKNLIITFESGSYSALSSIDSLAESEDFEFKVSYNTKTEACLVECFGNESEFFIARCLPTTHPVQIARFDNNNTKRTYLGPLVNRLKPETTKALLESLANIGFTQEIVKNCIEFARDKDERLKAEWVDKVASFISSLN